MTKKFIMAIVGPRDADSVMNALVAHQYPVTRAASSGGFLRRGSLTLFVGVDEQDVPSVLDVIRFACHSEPEPDQHRATLFVLEAPLYEHL